MATNKAVHAYDTLSIARKLQKDYAFNEKQAEGIARTIHQHLAPNVATKDDLAELRGEISELRAEMRSEFAKIHNKIDNLN